MYKFFGRDYATKAKRRGTQLLLFLAVFLQLGSIGFAQTGERAAPEEEQLILGFMNGLFSDVHIADALAATKVWATELKRKKGFGGPADAVVFDGIPSAMEALTKKSVDLLVLRQLKEKPYAGVR